MFKRKKYYAGFVFRRFFGGLSDGCSSRRRFNDFFGGRFDFSRNIGISVNIFIASLNVFAAVCRSYGYVVCYISARRRVFFRAFGRDVVRRFGGICAVIFEFDKSF